MCCFWAMQAMLRKNANITDIKISNHVCIINLIKKDHVYLKYEQNMGKKHFKELSVVNKLMVTKYLKPGNAEKQ